MNTQKFVNATAQYHSELCPKAWDGTVMKPEVRERLIDIAQVFVDYLDVPEFDVLDVVLTGSMANYNWTQFSDFDIHVVTRYTDLNADEIAEAFYRAKKTIWNDQHDITILGHEAELYVEDLEEPPVSGGVYSILRGKWVDQPKFEEPKINDTAIVKKVRAIAREIEHCIEQGDTDDLQRITVKLRNMRRAGLDASGEFSTENLAFKTLRNMGMIDRLHRAYTQGHDKSLSLL